jgi:hypothetical protein
MAEPKVTGLQTVLKNLNREIEAMERASVRGLYRGGLLIQRTAQTNSPVVTGNLRASGYTVTVGAGFAGGKMPAFKGKNKNKLGRAHVAEVLDANGALSKTNGPQCIVGFTAAYAAFVHENPNAGRGKAAAGKPIYKRRSEVGGAKFLERSVAENQKKVLQLIEIEARRSIK